MFAAVRAWLFVLGLLFVATPAAAQWTRVLDVPASDVFSVWANGDTIVAGADTVAYVSTDAGVSWKRSARLPSSASMVKGAWIRNGRLYAGTFGQGVFVSDDLGTVWSAYSQGLVGGIANAQLFIEDLIVRGDSLYIATSGAGAWVRNIAGPASTWIHFGNAFESNQASNMNAIAASDTRLLAAAGFNGTVFFRDRAAADWTLSWLNNVGAAPGLGALSAIWTGQGWVVGTNLGVFISPSGQVPWTPTGPQFGTVFGLSFALRGRDLFAQFGNGASSVIELSRDDGATWHELETLDQTFIYKLAVSGSDLYAGRFDGLWRRSIATVSVPDDPAPLRLRFAVAGAQPVGDEIRFRFDLPASGPIAIDVFDIAGRRAGESIRGSWPAGANEIRWDTHGLRAGVYLARLQFDAEFSTTRFVLVR